MLNPVTGLESEANLYKLPDIFCQQFLYDIIILFNDFRIYDS